MRVRRHRQGEAPRLVCSTDTPLRLVFNRRSQHIAYRKNSFCPPLSLFGRLLQMDKRIFTTKPDSFKKPDDVSKDDLSIATRSSYQVNAA